MTIGMIQCPHCLTRVVPMNDGTCPACRRNSREAPAVTLAREHRATPEEAWDRYKESRRTTSLEPATLRQFDEHFAELRTGAVSRLKAGAGADIAAAERIEQWLLPRYAAALEQLQQEGHAASGRDDAARLIEYMRTREESWRRLAEALRGNDAEKLKRHMELWEKSEILMLHRVAARQSLAKPTPAQRLKEFRRALLTFTPRLIATPAIVSANLLVFAAMIATGVHLFAPTVQSVAEWGANFGPKTMNGQWWRLVTCMFLHYGILHLGLNMWVLWDLGGLVERLVGNFGFIVLYFVSGIAGSMASLAWNPLVVSAGASGAVFGVAGALLGLIAFRRDTVPAEVLKHLRNSMVAFLAYNVFYGIAAPGIDMAAHVGGLAAGFVCGLLLSQPLSVEMIARRRLRNAAMLAAGAIVLPIAVFALPDAPLDMTGEMEQIAKMEKLAITRYNALVTRSQGVEMSEADFAETLEREVLPPWIKARGRIERLLDGPHADRVNLFRIVDYMRCREQSWRMRAEGLREQDLGKLEQANERWAMAEEMGKLIAGH